MCLKYSKGDGTYYARLCYKTGRRGEHVDLTQEQAEHWSERKGMFHRGGGRNERTSQPIGALTVTFDIGQCDDASVADMARYMSCDRYTQDPDNGHITFWVEHGVTPHDLRRAESFGWKRITVAANSSVPIERVEHQRPGALEERQQKTKDWLKRIEEIFQSS